MWWCRPFIVFECFVLTHVSVMLRPALRWFSLGSLVRDLSMSGYQLCSCAAMFIRAWWISGLDRLLFMPGPGIHSSSCICPWRRSWLRPSALLISTSELQTVHLTVLRVTDTLHHIPQDSILFYIRISLDRKVTSQVVWFTWFFLHALFIFMSFLHNVGSFICGSCDFLHDFLHDFLCYSFILYVFFVLNDSLKGNFTQ